MKHSPDLSLSAAPQGWSRLRLLPLASSPSSPLEPGSLRRGWARLEGSWRTEPRLTVPGDLGSGLLWWHARRAESTLQMSAVAVQPAIALLCSAGRRTNVHRGPSRPQGGGPCPVSLPAGAAVSHKLWCTRRDAVTGRRPTLVRAGGAGTGTPGPTPPPVPTLGAAALWGWDGRGGSTHST